MIYQIIEKGHMEMPCSSESSMAGKAPATVLLWSAAAHGLTLAKPLSVAQLICRAGMTPFTFPKGVWLKCLIS